MSGVCRLKQAFLMGTLCFPAVPLTVKWAANQLRRLHGDLGAYRSANPQHPSAFFRDRSTPGRLNFLRALATSVLVTQPST
jgi:hypothetical protein